MSGRVLYASLLGVSLPCACAPRVRVITEPTAVTVESHASRETTPTPRRVYATYWDAIGDLAPNAALPLAANDDQTQFARLLHDVLRGATDRAETQCRALLASSDSVVRTAARVTYGALLSTQSRWRELAAFVATRPDSTMMTHDDAGVEMWAPAFAPLHERATFTDSISTLPFTRTPTGIPMIVVFVNGTPVRLWIDTGSSLTILSTPVADTCGVRAITPDTLELVTAVGRVRARPAAVASMRVGGLHLEDVPAMIIDPSALQLRASSAFPVTAGNQTPTRSVAVDGVIGLDVLRHLDLTIDDRRGLVTIRRPSPSTIAERQQTPRNLVWFGVPIVTLTSIQGVPLHFSLDTGAEETYATLGLVHKTGARAVLAERRNVHGFGGSTAERGALIPLVHLRLGAVRISLARVFLYDARYPTIFALDGTLGADVGRGGVMRIDVSNGIFEVR